MLHAHDVGTNSVGFEDVWHHGTHAAVGRCERDDLTWHIVAVLVHHGGRDGQEIISRDGCRQWRYHQLCRSTRCDRDRLCTANQTETRGDGMGSNGAWCVQAVQSDRADVNGPLDRWALDH